MAATYNVVTQYAGIDTLGGTKTVDVLFVGITTKPHGTYIEFPIDQSVYSTGLVQGAAEVHAQIVETVWQQDHVVGVQWTQVVNASNLLASSLIVTVSSASGNSTASFTTALTDIPPDADMARIAYLSAELTATENL